jgi:hypothetical protein
LPTTHDREKFNKLVAPLWLIEGGDFEMRFMTILVGLVALSIAVGCGSDSDDGSASSAQSNNGSQARTGGTSSERADDEQAETRSDEGGEGGEAGSSSNKEEFVKQAAAGCSKAREDALRQLTAYTKEHRGEGRSEEEVFQEAAATVFPSAVEGEIAAIKEAGAPSDDADEIEAIVAELEATLAEARASKGLSFEEMEGLFVDPDRKLEAYGLGACSKN